MAHNKPPDFDDPRNAAKAVLADLDNQEAARLNAQAVRKAKTEKRKTLWLAFQWTLIAVCLAVVAYQTPQFIEALSREEKPFRQGTMATDSLTDQCLASLWKASKRLQEGDPVGADLICPASGQPFEIITVKEDVIVRSPKPELYGFREIRVSKKKPIPELIK